jgi:hypothetical protein
MKLNAKQQSQIAIYSPLAEGLSIQIQRVLDGKMTSAGLTLLETGVRPHPYVQVGLPDENGRLTLEVISNTFLETKLTDWQIGQLMSNGWKAPDEGNPNFWMVTDSQDTTEMSKVMVYAMHLVFGLRPDTWFTFGTAPLDEAMNNSGLFWHMKGKTGVVCLPGQNMEYTLEGSR